MSKKFLILLAVGLVALRWIFPESDPAWWLNVEDLHDEAWWAENARRKILFNEWMWDEYAGALASGPLAVVWHWINFKLWGINFFSLRLISLIPASLILALLWFRNPLSSSTNKIGFFLLASSPLFFALNRVGYIEIMLMLIMLLSISLVRQNSLMSSIIAGALFCCGLLFKGSFIFILAPLLLWLWMDSGIRKQLIISISVLAILSSVSVLVYFIPKQELFLPYITAFSEDFIPSNFLYDPRGWIARLAWLPEKNWLSSILGCWLAIYLLIKISKGFVPRFKSSAWGLFLLILAASLFTDFSDRRLSILILLLPFIVTEDFSNKLSNTQYTLFGFLLTLSILPWLIGVIPSNAYNILLFQSGKIGIILLGIILIIYFLLKEIKTNQPSLVILRIGIVSWIFALMHYSALNLAELLGFSYFLVMGIQTLGCLLVLNAEYKFLDKGPSISTLAKTLIAIQLVLILSIIVFPSFTLKESALFVSKHVNYGERIWGPNNSVELSFLSTGKTFMYQTEKPKIDYQFIGYFPNYSMKDDSLLENNLNYSPKYETTFLLFPLLNKYKCEAIIVKSVPIFDKNQK